MPVEGGGALKEKGNVKCEKEQNNHALLFILKDAMSQSVRGRLSQTLCLVVP